MESEQGSALAEHVFALVLVMAVALGLLQLALTVHVRNTLTACAAEGARVAAVVAGARGSGEDRARQCARDSVGVEAEVTVEAAVIGESAAVVVTVEAPGPVLGPWHAGRLTARARAIDEAALGAG